MEYIFLNDLVQEINDLNIAIPVDDSKIWILLYADDMVLLAEDMVLLAEDMVLLAENERNLQIMINKLNEFCTKWRLTINIDKTYKMHFRRATSYYAL